jgi:phosphoribosylformylglycinamidine synthase
VVGVLGVFDDVARRIPMGFLPLTGSEGDQLFLLGATDCELSGSEWAWVTHGHLGGRPPKIDLERERALGALMAQASRSALVTAAHDLSDGGLAQSLVESCLRRNVGAQITLPNEHPAFVQLFSESAGRAVVAVPRGHEKAFVALAAEHAVPCTQIGVTTADPVLDIHDQFTVGLDELRAAHTATLPRLFGGLAQGAAAPEGVAAVEAVGAPDADAVAAPDADAVAPTESAPSSEGATPSESSDS